MAVKKASKRTARSTGRMKTAAGKKGAAAPPFRRRTAAQPARTRGRRSEEKGGLSIVRLVSILFSALLLGVGLFFSAPSGTSRAFRGYITVFYRGTRPPAEVIAVLQKQPGVNAVVSRETADVLYSDFSGLASVPLAQVASRFDPLDQRFDEYMKRLERYFTVRDGDVVWSIFFVDTASNPLSLLSALRGIDGTRPEEWSLGESLSPERTWAVIVLGTLFFIFLLMQSHRPVFHMLTAVGILVWFPAFAGSDSEAFGLCFFIAAYWAFFLKEYICFCDETRRSGGENKDRFSMLLRLGVFGGMILFLFIAAAIATRHLIAAAGAFCFLALAAAFYRLAPFTRPFFKKLRLPFHARRRRFAPSIRVPMLRPVFPGRRLSIPFIVLILCLMPFLLLPPGAPLVTSPPQPRPVTPGAPLTMESLRRLAEKKSDSFLPDLSDFVTHVAYQEKCAYELKPEYTFPSPGETHAIAEYRSVVPGRPVTRSLTTVLSFDDQWLTSLKDRTGRSSVERMLFSQGECFRVAVSREVTSVPPAAGGWTFIIIFSIVLFPMLLLHYTAFPNGVHAKKKGKSRSARKRR